MKKIFNGIVGLILFLSLTIVATVGTYFQLDVLAKLTFALTFLNLTYFITWVFLGTKKEL